MSGQEKKDKALELLADVDYEIRNLSTFPMKAKVWLVIQSLYEIMRLLSDMTDERE